MKPVANKAYMTISSKSSLPAYTRDVRHQQEKPKPIENEIEEKRKGFSLKESAEKLDKEAIVLGSNKKEIRSRNR